MIIDISVNLFISAIEFYLAYLFYNIFWERKQQLAVIDACAIGVSVILLLLSSIPFFQPYATYLTIIAFFLLSFRFDISFLWKFFGIVIVLVILSVGEAIAAALLMMITDQTAPEINQQKLFYLSGKIFSKFIALFILKILSQFRRDKKLNTLYSSALTLTLPIASCFIVCIMSYFVRLDGSLHISIMVLAVYILLLLSNIFLIDLLEKIYDIRLAKETLKIGQKSLKHEEKYYQAFLNQQDEIMQIIQESHDFKNKLTAALGLMEHGKIESALQIIEDMANKKSDTDFFDTGNVALDAIISSKLKDIHALSINFCCNIQFPDNCIIEYQDLAIIAGNIFDNAIKACQGVSDTDSRFIRFTVKQRQDYLCFKMENSLSFDRNCGELASESDFNLVHGIGLNNVKMISDKYNGNLKIDINQQARIFSIIVILTNKPKH